jgi:hypothetical protein
MEESSFGVWREFPLRTLGLHFFPARNAYLPRYVHTSTCYKLSSNTAGTKSWAVRWIESRVCMDVYMCEMKHREYDASQRNAQQTPRSGFREESVWRRPAAAASQPAISLLSGVVQYTIPPPRIKRSRKMEFDSSRRRTLQSQSQSQSQSTSTQDVGSEGKICTRCRV